MLGKRQVWLISFVWLWLIHRIWQNLRGRDIFDDRFFNGSEVSLYSIVLDSLEESRPSIFVDCFCHIFLAGGLREVACLVQLVYSHMILGHPRLPCTWKKVSDLTKPTTRIRSTILARWWLDDAVWVQSDYLIACRSASRNPWLTWLCIAYIIYRLHAEPVIQFEWYRISISNEFPVDPYIMKSRQDADDHRNAQ